MTETSGGGRGGTPRGRRTPGTRKEDWIGNQFRRVYDQALNEPIPQQMLDLLSALDESDKDDEERT